MTSDSPEYALVTGEARAESEPAFVDAWPAAGNGEAPGFTRICPPGHPDMQDERIDYCFLCPALADKVRVCRVDQEAKGSDHQPLWTEFAP
jgi:endonuclease/exonuclease/phosphatase family metal-dependent hydrolase